MFLYSKRERIENFIFLGDAVGYGAYPNECVEKIDSAVNIKLVGNHEAGLLKTLPLSYFNTDAASAIKWTQTVISSENLAKIKRWKSTASEIIKQTTISFSHSKLSQPEKWDYIFNEWDALIEFKMTEPFKVDILFIGHTHVPCCYIHDIDKDSVVSVLGEFNIVLEKNRRYIINTGSVGQPRDRDIRSSFVVLDDKDMSVSLIRNHYEVTAASDSILKKNLPVFLASRLLKGV